MLLSGILIFFFLKILDLLPRRLALYHARTHITFGGNTGDGFGVLALGNG